MTPRLRSLRTALLALAISTALHACLAGPTLARAWVTLEAPEVAGPDGSDGPMGDGAVGTADGTPELLAPLQPVAVSLYAAAAAPRPGIGPGPAPKAPGTGSAPRTPVETRKGRPEPIPRGREGASGIEGKPPRGNKKPCDPVEEITRLDTYRYRVERSLVDYYAHHLKEFDRQAATSTARDERGKPEGLLVYLPRCGVLRQAGLRNGDIVLSVNDKKVATLIQGIGTWLALRKKQDITVKLRRKSGEELAIRYRITK